MIWRLIFFILNEIYYILNMKRLDSSFKDKSQNGVRKLDLFYYVMRILSVPFLIEGILSSFSPVFLLLLSIWIFKIVLYHISDKAYHFSAIRFPFFSIINILVYMIVIYLIIR
jgi:hypothetical protein